MYNQISLEYLCLPTQGQICQWNIISSVKPFSDADSYPPLIKAVKDQDMDTAKKIETVRHLIESRVDIDFINYKKKTALVYAIRLAEIPVIQLLLDAKADPHLSTTLINAVLMESMEMTKIILNASKVFNPHSGVETILKKCDQFGQTPLMWAVAQRNIDLVTLLIQENADVNATNCNGNTPLIYATRPARLLPERMQYSPPIVSLLLQARADLTHCNAYGNQALFYARKFRQKTVCQQLFDAGMRLPTLQFHELKNQVQEIEERIQYPILDLLEFAKALLVGANIPFNQRHFSVHHPLVLDIKEALAMASELMLQGTHVDKLELHCLLKIIKEKYESQYETLTDEQIEDAIHQQAQIKANTLKPENYDYIDYDQTELAAAMTTHLARNRYVAAGMAGTSRTAGTTGTACAIPGTGTGLMTTGSTIGSRPNYYTVLHHRIFGQGTTDQHYASLCKVVKQLIFSLSNTDRL